MKSIKKILLPSVVLALVSSAPFTVNAKAQDSPVGESSWAGKLTTRDALRPDAVGQMIADAKYKAKLLGRCRVEDLDQQPFGEKFKFDRPLEWDSKLVEQLRESATDNNIRCKLFLGTWCGDTQREVPKLLRLFETIQWPMENLEMHAVDYVAGHYKMDPAGQARKHRVHRVPTLIVMRGDQTIGRIVETPTTSWEMDLAQILAGLPSDSRYPVADLVFRWVQDDDEALKSVPAEPVETSEAKPPVDSEPFQKTVDALRSRSRGPTELSTLVRVLLERGDTRSALRVANINIRLHPAEPRVIASLATAAFRAGYRDTALAQCKRAIRMRPQEERY
ncbi:MAG: hypothetical protein AAF958_17525, partial [Planctomycetota bacterium]